jgi:hypothetical protein
MSCVLGKNRRGAAIGRVCRPKTRPQAQRQQPHLADPPPSFSKNAVYHGRSGVPDLRMLGKSGGL